MTWIKKHPFIFFLLCRSGSPCWSLLRLSWGETCPGQMSSLLQSSLKNKSLQIEKIKLTWMFNKKDLYSLLCPDSWSFGLMVYFLRSILSLCHTRFCCHPFGPIIFLPSVDHPISALLSAPTYLPVARLQGRQTHLSSTSNHASPAEKNKELNCCWWWGCELQSCSRVLLKHQP